jgi:hypothetical protein
MKRLALHVLFCLLTFSAGVGIERLLSGTTQTQPETAPVASMAYQPLLDESLVLAQPVSTPTPALSPTSNFILDYDITKFDPTGEYRVLGRTAAPYSEFQGFTLNFYKNEDGALTGDMVVWTNTSEEDYDDHKAFGLVTERRLILATYPNEKNVVYRFEGEFLRTRVIADTPEGTAVVKGVVIKSINGRKVSETKVKFEIVVDHC